MPIVSLPAAVAVWTCTNGRVAPTAPAVTFSARRRVIRRTRVMGCSSLYVRAFYLYFFELNFRCLRHPRCRLRLAGNILALAGSCPVLREDRRSGRWRVHLRPPTDLWHPNHLGPKMRQDAGGYDQVASATMGTLFLNAKAVMVG